jgi:hypothetical protein
MLDAESTIEIALPPRKVWEYLIDFPRWAEWMDIDPRLEVTMKPEESGQIGFGAGRKVLYSDSAGVKREYSIKDWQPLQALALESPAPAASLYKLTLAESSPQSTKVTLRLEVHLQDGPLVSLVGTLLGFPKSVEITAQEVLKQLDAAVREA